MGNCCTERKKVEEKIDIEKEEEGINKIEAFQPQTNNSSISLPTPISPHGSSLGITTLTSKKKINDSNQDDENELLPQTNEQKNLQSNTSSTKNTSKEKEKSSSCFCNIY